MSIAEKEKIFLTKLEAKYPDMYETTGLIYVNGLTPITILCKKHDLVFEQKPHAHTILGQGCPECGKEKIGRGKSRKVASEFVARSEAVHGKKYDYSLVKYTLVEEDVDIICPIHGVFKQ